MRNVQYLILAGLVGLAVTGSACTQKAADETSRTTDAALDKAKAGADTVLEAAKDGAATAVVEIREAGEKTADATKNVSDKTVQKTKEIASAIVAKTEEVSATTGEVITDAWITTKVSAKFVDEALLKNSDIDVDTDDRVVTLKGTVTSAAASTRAAAIARGTEGVTRVVNQIVVKPAAA